LTFTEMAHVESFLKRNRLALEKIAVRDLTPVQIQLLTGRENELERFLEGFTPFPGFEGFNLNLSCPSPDVIGRGKGAAMIKRAAKTQRLVSLIRSHGHAVSLKMRLGTNAHERELKVYLNAIQGVDADFFVVHAKTAAQSSAEPEDYSVFPECVNAAGGRPVIANGSIDSPEKVEFLKEMSVGGVMIGRGALSNPAIFDYLKNRLRFNEPSKLVPTIPELRKEYAELYISLNGGERYRDNFYRVVGKKVSLENY
jgi:tRNA-dihydrouridine synthase B